MTRFIDTTNIPLSDLLNDPTVDNNRLCSLSIGRLRELQAAAQVQGAQKLRAKIVAKIPTLKYAKQIVANTKLEDEL